MIRLILGFILGVAAAYYTVPSLNALLKAVSATNIPSFFASNELTHSSNTFNAMAPSELSALNNGNDSIQIRTAITLISARELDDPASIFTINLISDLIERKPKLQPYVRAQLNNGMTNKEALNIFEKYDSL